MASLGALLVMMAGTTGLAAAAPTAPISGGGFKTGDPKGTYTCGSGTDSVQMSIDIGCAHKGGAITDAVFAIIRLLSDGVGLVVVGSIIVGGIQYTASAGDPGATSRAVGRIRESLIALLIFIFGYAILNFVIPAGFLK